MIKRGDFFCVEGKSLLSRLIKWRTSGKVSHAGIILDRHGETFEALTKIRRGRLEDYLGKRIVIYRPIADDARIEEALRWVVEEYKGKEYPWWRLFLHLLDIDKFSLLDIPVCSELVTLYLSRAGLWHGSVWGVNPDDLENECTVSDKYAIIYHGRLYKAW